MHRYRAFGLSIESELELPELAQGSGPVELSIRVGEVPRHLDQPLRTGVLFEVDADDFLLRVEGIGGFRAHRGVEIVVDPAASSDSADIRALLLSSVFNAVLHQRGLLSLHAGAVAGKRGAVLIAGNSGAGKSTLLATLAARGHRVLADDVVGVDVREGGRIEVAATYPQLRLWHDAVVRLGEDPDRHQRIRSGLEKYAFPIQRWSDDVVEVSAMCVLRLWNEERVTMQHPAAGEKFAIVRAQTRLARVMEGAGVQQQHFRSAARFADRVPIARIFRPRIGDTAAEIAALIETEFL